MSKWRGGDQGFIGWTWTVARTFYYTCEWNENNFWWFFITSLDIFYVYSLCAYSEFCFISCSFYIWFETFNHLTFIYTHLNFVVHSTLNECTLSFLSLWIMTTVSYSFTSISFSVSVMCLHFWEFLCCSSILYILLQKVKILMLFWLMSRTMMPLVSLQLQLLAG